MVLSADECEQSGLEVVPMPGDVRELISKKAPGLENWLGNPVDFSILGADQMGLAMEMMHTMAGSSGFDFLIGNLTEENPFDDSVWNQLISLEAEEYLKVSARGLRPIVATISNPGLGISSTAENRWRTLLEKRELLAENGIAVYPSVKSAASALNKLVNYYRGRQRLLHGGIQ